MRKTFRKRYTIYSMRYDCFQLFIEDTIKETAEYMLKYLSFILDKKGGK